jgi:outer membrane protein, heavy metal efflux system
MKRIILSIIITSATITVMMAQGTNAFLNEVAASHPLLKSYAGQLEVARAGSVTGNTPGPFTMGFGYFPGTPDAIGLKRTFSASQSFEFPTKYIKRGKLNRETFALAETEYKVGWLQTLNEARSEAYDYIGLSVRLAVLEEKLKGYSLLREGWSQMLDEGAVTLPDYNRLQLELSLTGSEMATVKAEMRALRVKLDYISGGKSTLLEGATFDELPDPDVAALIAEKRSMHPAWLLHEQEHAVSLQAVGLSRTDNLPDIEVGFGSEIIAGEHHTGPTVGLSLPVWTNRNQVKLARSKAEAAALSRDAAHSALAAEIESLYEYCMAVKVNMLEMRENSMAAGDISPLTEALTEKEITITEYFSHMEAVFASREALINLETEYHKTVAILYDHLLLRGKQD